MAVETFFRKAERKRARARVGLMGPSGSGKSLYALLYAKGMQRFYKEVLGRDIKIAAVDTERESLSLYDDVVDFDTFPLKDSFDPRHLVKLIGAAQEEKYGILIVDSLSHFWTGKDGTLAFVDRTANDPGNKSKNSFAAWRQGTELQNEMLDTLLQSSLHILATVRTKTSYVQEKSSDGNTSIRRVALDPVQRDGLEYEFTICVDIDQQTHKSTFSKSRWRLGPKGHLPDKAEWFGYAFAGWLNKADVSEVESDGPRALENEPATHHQSSGGHSTVGMVGSIGVNPASFAHENGTVADPGPSEPISSGPILATPATLAQLYDVFALVGYTPKQVTNILEKRGVVLAEALTEAQAAEIVAKCRAKYEEKTANPANPAKPASDSGPAATVESTPPTTTLGGPMVEVTPVKVPDPDFASLAQPESVPEPVRIPDPVTTAKPVTIDPYFATQQQVDEILAIAPLYPKKDGSKGFGEVELKNFIAKRINANTGQPCAEPEELSREQAVEIITNLRKKIGDTTDIDQLANRFAGMSASEAAVAAGASTPELEAARSQATMEADRLATQFSGSGAKVIRIGDGPTPPLQEALVEVFAGKTFVNTVNESNGAGNIRDTHNTRDAIDDLQFDPVHRPEKLEPVKAPGSKGKPSRYDQATGAPIWD